MTANELLRQIQRTVYMLSSGDLPIKYNGKDMNVSVVLEKGKDGYYINIQDL